MANCDKHTWRPAVVEVKGKNLCWECWDKTGTSTLVTRANANWERDYYRKDKKC